MSETTYLVHLVAGSTGAGKTTYSLALCKELGAIHIPIDEWMTTLFWMDSPDPISHAWAMERIGRVEAQIWTLVQKLAEQGVPVVLDLGFTKREHRQKFAALAREAGLPLQLHYVDVPAEERWARVEKRNAEKGETFAMEVTRDMFDFMESMWQAPEAAEIADLNGVRVA
ncbi:AAA family ATPase [Emcibacter nanhaiensis]|uniref:ATP-binding protein n=1 Tax=Emcibacter nanhaiensis TaxID=1505037 RepID=A0A501PML9_9PROT|nr:ATP-binding protein [Emcibacter nanhaiensis]TPD61398.1 ATP-binding protein [Emcibacter nanhaiensis]